MRALGGNLKYLPRPKIEARTGDYLGEDDFIRYEDICGQPQNMEKLPKKSSPKNVS
ncbi:MAG: hypothetical protein PHP25_01730 [Candidatus Moranbacteria bacterium]|nr:hypothetical protein [Candidatus Moranbacteria bacterium]